MKKMVYMMALLICLLSVSSCYTLTHQVGNGAQGGATVEKRQWYLLYGLVPLNEVDSHAMAEGATDYTITSQHTFLDLVISAITGFVTIQAKTVKVTK